MHRSLRRTVVTLAGFAPLGLAPLGLRAQGTVATNVAGTYAPGTSLATPGTYSTPNGVLTSVGSDPVRWLDNIYTDGCSTAPCPRTTPGAPLSGGAGKLTDNVRPTVDALNGDGYVVWNSGSTTLSFFFLQVYDFASVRLLLANGNEFGFGGLYRPGVTINNTGYSYGALANGTESRWWQFDLTGLRTDRVDITFSQVPGLNYGLAQADFAGTAFVAPPTDPLPNPTTVPEPSTYALVAAGLAALVAIRRPRRVTA